MTRQIIILTSILLSGCATKYQPMGFTGGYRDFEAQPGIHYIVFRGNGYSSPDNIIEYWHRHAAEVCGGKDKYEVLKSEDVSRITYSAVTTTSGSFNTYGNSGDYQGNSVSELHERKHPAMAGYVKCMGDQASTSHHSTMNIVTTTPEK